MNSTGKDLSRQTAIQSLGGFNPQQVIAMLAQTADTTDINDVRARVAAAKAWAKVHGMVKDTRLDLLKIEVAALKRLGELEAFEGLNAAERESAQWLASASDDEVAEAIAKAGNVTTAASVVRSAKEFSRIRERYEAGYSWASNPPARDEGFAGYTDDEIDEAREDVPSITAILNELIEEYTEAGQPFTVDEVAEAVISRGRLTYDRGDGAFHEGVRRVCREALSKSVPKQLGDTPLPRFVACRTEDGKFVRVPISNAKLPHLDDMIAIREEQLQRDARAIERLRDIRDRLDEMLLGRSRTETSIGQLLISRVESAA